MGCYRIGPFNELSDNAGIVLTNGKGISTTLEFRVCSLLDHLVDKLFLTLNDTRTVQGVSNAISARTIIDDNLHLLANIGKSLDIVSLLRHKTRYHNKGNSHNDNKSNKSTNNGASRRMATTSGLSTLSLRARGSNAYHARSTWLSICGKTR